MKKGQKSMVKTDFLCSLNPINGQYFIQRGTAMKKISGRHYSGKERRNLYIEAHNKSRRSFDNTAEVATIFD